MRRWMPLLLFFVGCSESSSDGTESAPDGGATTTCTRVAALLEAPTACGRDEDCPCGSHCDLGQCAHACLADADCAEGTCDAFGRCATGGRLSSASRPRFVVEPSVVSVRARGAERVLRVRAAGEAVGPVRVVADPGATVRCGEGDFAAECRFEALDAAGAAVRVRVAEDAPAADVSLGVRFHAAGQRERVGVEVALGTEAKARKAARPVGLYEGFAWPLGGGFSSRPDAPANAALARLRVPVTAVVKATGDTFIVDLADGIGALFPDDTTIATLRLDDRNAWTLAVPPRPFLGPDAPGADDVEVTYAAASREATWEGERLAAVVRVTYGGATLHGDAPFVDWQLALAWIEARDTASQAPRAFAPALSADRAATPLAVEATIAGALPLPEGAERRTRALLCTASGAADPDDLGPDIATTDGEPLPSGDLGCLEGGPQRTFGVLATSLVDLADAVAACIADDGAAVLTTAGCVDASRVVAALAEALGPDRERALGTRAEAVPTASALGHRLLQQWLSVAVFTAVQAPEVAKLEGVVLAEDTLSFTPLEAFDAALARWDLLLHPRFAAALPKMPPSLLAAPDYRPLLFPGAPYADAPSHDHAVGLPVAILDTVRHQAVTAEWLLGEVTWRRQTLADVEPRVRAFLRRAHVALGIAQGMYDNARTLGPPPWQAEWDTAVAGAAGALARILRALDAARSGANPLGIEEVDLPIYRVGDQNGALRRFFALSDALVGTGAEVSLALDQVLVDRAQAQLDAARSEWASHATRDFRNDLTQAEQSRRLEGIARRYGEQIISLCGNPSWVADTVLDMWDGIDANDCFLAPGCTFEDGDLRERLTSADLGFELCFAAKLRTRLGPNVTSGDAAIDEVIDTVGGALYQPEGPFGVSLRIVNDQLVIGYRENTYSVPFDDVVSVEVPEGLPHEFVTEAHAVCESARQATLALRPSLPPDACAVTDDCPVGYLCRQEGALAGTCDPDLEPDQADRPECFLGALGELAVSLRSAAREVDIARSEMDELTERYDIAMKSCLIAQVANDRLEETLETHNDVMSTLGTAKLAVDIAANFAAAAKDVASADTVFTGGAKGVAAVAEASLRSVSDGLQFAMDEATRKHDEQMTRLQSSKEEAVCYNEAEGHLVGTRTAALKVQAATLALTRTLVEFENTKNALRSWLLEGHEALEYERARRVPPLNVQHWFDEKVARYDDHLRQARRALWLTVRAVEYETQQSLATERDLVLRARSPGDLQRALDALRGRTQTGTVDGGSPADLFAVVSLRDHLLQLDDRADAPEGWHQLDRAARFRLLLTDPGSAVYDEDGQWLGQEIPFALAPLEALALGDAQGLPLLTGTDCAERLWSVNASILGTDLYPGSDTTLTRLVLRKRNTFYSQWCEDGHADAFQMASTRPERNLFLDPYTAYGNLDDESYAASVPEPGGGDVDSTQAFTDARIQAYFNVARGALEDERYFNGDSQELAGRGLYGDYALFFPRETLSVDGGPGLVLDHVDDVLLRFDYVSVARRR